MAYTFVKAQGGAIGQQLNLPAVVPITTGGNDLDPLVVTGRLAPGKHHVVHQRLRHRAAPLIAKKGRERGHDKAQDNGRYAHYHQQLHQRKTSL